MMRATKIIHPPFDAFDSVSLDSVDRHRRRLQMTCDGGLNFLLDLEQAVLLHHNDGLVLEDGRIVKVSALPEELFKVTGTSHLHLLRLCYQLGNRHQPAEICADHIKIRRDPIIAEMVTGLGGTVECITDRFNPEGGAYDQSHEHIHE